MLSPRSKRKKDDKQTEWNCNNDSRGNEYYQETKTTGDGLHPSAFGCVTDVGQETRNGQECDRDKKQRKQQNTNPVRAH